jgi:hypothetical protein
VKRENQGSGTNGSAEVVYYAKVTTTWKQQGVRSTSRVFKTRMALGELLSKGKLKLTSQDLQAIKNTKQLKELLKSIEDELKKGSQPATPNSN